MTASPTDVAWFGSIFDRAPAAPGAPALAALDRRQGEAVAGQELPQPVGVVGRAARRARRREQDPARLRQRAGLPADAHDVLELDALEAIQRGEPPRRHEPLQ